MKLIIEEVQASNNSDEINDEIVVILGKLLEYNSISKKQHKQSLIKWKLLHTEKK